MVRKRETQMYRCLRIPGVYDRPQEWKGTLAKKTTYEHIKNANKYSVS